MGFPADPKARLPSWPVAPDRFELCVRFTCGWLAGVVVAFLVAVRFVSSFSVAFWAVVLGTAFLFGYFAMRRGDPFWYGLARILGFLQGGP